MDDTVEAPYVRRYPALSVETEFHFVTAIRHARLFGREFVMLPDGTIVRRPGMTPHRLWKIRQEAVRQFPLPSEFRHLDDWAVEPEPPRDPEAQASAPRQSWLRRTLARLFA